MCFVCGFFIVTHKIHSVMYVFCVCDFFLHHTQNTTYLLYVLCVFFISNHTQNSISAHILCVVTSPHTKHGMKVGADIGYVLFAFQCYNENVPHQHYVTMGEFFWDRRGPTARDFLLFWSKSGKKFPRPQLINNLM